MHATASKTSRLVEREVVTRVVDAEEKVLLELSTEAARYLRTLCYSAANVIEPTKHVTDGGETIRAGRKCMDDIYEALKPVVGASPGYAWQYATEVLWDREIER